MSGDVFGAFCRLKKTLSKIQKSAELEKKFRNFFFDFFFLSNFSTKIVFQFADFTMTVEYT